MNRPLLTTVAILACCLAACQAPAPDSPETDAVSSAAVDTAGAYQAIAQITNAYEAAAGTGDHAAITALYADDALIHPANQPAVSGREALAAYFTETYGQPVDITFTTNDIVFSESGDLAYEVGTMASTAGPGKYVTIYRRDGDGWLIVADTWSDDAPPAAPAN